MVFQQFDELLKVYIAVGKEDGIVRAIVFSGEQTCIVGSEVCHHVATAQYVVAQRVSAEQQVLEVIVDKFGRLVVVTLYFVAYHIQFAPHFSIRISAVEYDVAQ